ncbi:DUF262 domain-containing protein [Ilumatobacter sp.]|uniref:GmrSD restriction endonuclease domain-containing protein n=1 Tax=Ilumatobacter sp. TaxID=1967498 RepID=UPI003750A4F1
METQPRTPQIIFMSPQRLMVPLFQRPYVWNQELQWEPLWNDVVRITERYMGDSAVKQQPHFLGAVVVQQTLNPLGSLQMRSVIDGQQRLTTLQLMIDAVHAQLVLGGSTQSARRLEALVLNDEAFCESDADRHKVWPTNKDRAAFNEVMVAPIPVEYENLAHRSSRLTQAHRFFSESAGVWLRLNGDDEISERGAALERSIRDHLQIVVIDLAADEDAQEIFETLNARGTPLTAADLIKNFVFQRLTDAGEDVEAIYESFWSEFETAFWETEVNSGRTKYPRSAMFLNHWLVARTREEVLAREVFIRFKRYVDFEREGPVAALVAELHRAAHVYRRLIEATTRLTGPLDRSELFAYRTSVMESEVIKPLLLTLLDPEQESIPHDQLTKALDVVESWMVRRMIVRATSKNYNQTVADMIARLHKQDRTKAGDTLEAFLREQRTAVGYWPDDHEVAQQLSNERVYKRLSRGRLRMILEAIEDRRRGWPSASMGFSERVMRGTYNIEHVMPVSWEKHWPLPQTVADFDRNQMIHTLGNLTLLTARLNTKVSNGQWAGANGKRAALVEHDVLKLNRTFIDGFHEDWTDTDIEARTATLTDELLAVWPVPEGHRSEQHAAPTKTHRKVEVLDLLSAGLIEPNTALIPRAKAARDRTVIVLGDGSIDVDGILFKTPSGAAGHIRGGPTNGWRYFRVQLSPRITLSDLWHDYVELEDIDTDSDDAGDDVGTE